MPREFEGAETPAIAAQEKLRSLYKQFPDQGPIQKNLRTIFLREGGEAVEASLEVPRLSKEQFTQEQQQELVFRKIDVILKPAQITPACRNFLTERLFIMEFTGVDREAEKKHGSTSIGGILGISDFGDRKTEGIFSSDLNVRGRIERELLQYAGKVISQDNISLTKETFGSDLFNRRERTLQLQLERRNAWLEEIRAMYPDQPLNYTTSTPPEMSKFMGKKRGKIKKKSRRDKR